MTLVDEKGPALSSEPFPERRHMNSPDITTGFDTTLSGIERPEWVSLIRQARMNAVKTDVAIATLRFELNRMFATAAQVVFGGRIS